MVVLRQCVGEARQDGTLDVGLDKIGQVSVPMTLSLPASPVLSGKATTVFTNKGVLKLPRKDVPYTFEVADVVLASDAAGIRMRGRAVLKAASGTSTR